jgi:Ca2+-binding RTX toxin-like protein
MRRRRLRSRRRSSRLGGGLLLLVAVAGLALTASNAVPISRADDVARATGVDDLQPSQCAGLKLSGLLTGAGTVSDPNGNASLILGSAGADTVTARNRSDCVVGGAGNDTIDGGQGTDVCIGGPGTDTFVACETTYP